MTEASAARPVSAFLTPASLKFPSKSTKNRYSKLFSGIGLDSIIVMLTLLKMKFPRMLYREPLLWAISKATLTFPAVFAYTGSFPRIRNLVVFPLTLLISFARTSIP